MPSGVMVKILKIVTHPLFKSLDNLAKWLDFAFWWSCIGKGLCLQTLRIWLIFTEMASLVERFSVSSMRDFIWRFLSGCLHIMSAKNGGVQTPPLPLLSKKSKIYLTPLPPCQKKSEFYQTPPPPPPCQKSYFDTLQLIW